MTDHTDRTAFRHEAFFYAGADSFVAGTARFIAESVAAGEPILVAVDPGKSELLRDRLGAAADGARFLDMAELGRNPARIIPAWRAFVDATLRADRPVRGIGEPIGTARSQAELDECHAHESLLNLAFADSPPWWLLCPYDTTALDPAVLDGAAACHPYVWDGAEHRRSDAYRDPARVGGPPGPPLPEPAGPVYELRFTADSVGSVRSAVTGRVASWGLDRDRTDDLVLSAHEVATNSVRHGGGSGLLRLWRDGGHVLCEIRDRGRIDVPMVGRELPPAHHTGGRGLWLANQLCDLVQIRSTGDGVAVRLRVGGLTG